MNRPRWETCGAIPAGVYVRDRATGIVYVVSYTTGPNATVAVTSPTGQRITCPGGASTIRSYPKRERDRGRAIREALTLISGMESIAA